MEEGKIDVEDNKSNGETEPKAPTSKLINENAATDAKPLKVFIYIDFFLFSRSFEKGICEYLNLDFPFAPNPCTYLLNTLDSRIDLYLELVPKEFNHLAAILHVYAGCLIFMK